MIWVLLLFVFFFWIFLFFCFQMGFYFVTTGWIFEIGLCVNSINQSKSIIMDWQGEIQQNPDRMNKGKRKTISVHDGAKSRTSTRSTAGIISNPRYEDYVFTRVRCNVHVFKGRHPTEYGRCRRSYAYFGA